MKNIVYALSLTGLLIASSPATAQQSHMHFGVVNNRSRLNSIDMYHNDLLHSLEVKSIGEVELTDDDSDIKTVAPNGFVIIKSRDWLTNRELRVSAGADGKVLREYIQQGNALDFEEYGKSWLARQLPEIARESGLGANGRVKRIIAQNGLDAAINEIRMLESGYAMEIYYNAILDQPNLTPGHLNRATATVAKEVSSSSRLGDLIIRTAVKFPDDSTLTESLIHATREISSSSKQGETLISIAHKRNLTVEASLAMAKSIESISSSSVQTEVLQIMADVFPASEEAFFAYLHAVRTISSSSGQGNAIEALLARRDLTRDAFLEANKTIETIASSSVQSDLLVRIAKICPNDDVVFKSFLKAVGQVSSSSGQEAAVMAMLSRDGLSKNTLKNTLKFARDEISSQSAQDRIEDRINEKLLNP